MMRRPPGHVAPQRKVILALALFLLPWLPLVDAQQQHRDALPAHHLRSPPEDDQHVAANLAATTVTGQRTVDTPRIHDRRKTTVTRESTDDESRRRNLARSANHENNNIYIPDDVRAHALAPDLGPDPGAGLSQQVARSLEDWEVEDFVLMATVDGDLYASDRKTGQERWHFKADHPMVETRHFRTNRSVLDDDYDPIDHYIWVVEPTRDGELYLWRPGENGAGLVKLAWTMKKVVEKLSPHNDKDNGVLYTGDKRTTMVTLNAATGMIIKQFGTSGSYVNKVESESCFEPNALADGEQECNDDRTITLGRTEYTVSIQRSDGSPIALLKYSEWGPNNLDNDLMQQNIITKDSRYITGQHDGKVYGFDWGRFSEERPVFTKTLSSPVARVFDVLHRWGPAPNVDPELIVLPQPPLPASDEDSFRLRSEKVFINQTEEGSWYALSGSRYPLILHAPVARIHRVDWWKIRESWELLNEDQKSSVLIGTHHLPGGFGTADRRHSSQKLLDAPNGQHENANLPDGAHTKLLPPPAPEPSRIFETAKRLPTLAAVTVFDLVSNPLAILLSLCFAWFFYKDKVISYSRKFAENVVASRFEASTPEKTPTPAAEEASAAVVEPEGSKPEVASPDTTPAESTPAETPPTDAPAEPILATAPTQEPAQSVTFAEPLEHPLAETAENGTGETVKKKKGHRGRRGGVKHRKGKDKREASQSRDDDPPQESVEEAVEKAKRLPPEPKLEPDIITIQGDADEISGPILKMGNLEVNLNVQLGTGSNGTIVYAGKWDSRDVAVKRMLVQFNEIASRETDLLRESDDHPNVIRYYAQQQQVNFLYIALELCQASLADVVQKPQAFRELAQAGERDMPSVLYQIANGLSHLHSLRIVHRDLKPQNILVNMGKNGRPRILVSDFGLCKKLEGGQSSFGATTAHAAGTTGWRAPELLVDDDAPHAGMTLEQVSSMHSASGSGVVVDGQGPHARRVTRAIDIFSLGLVFYYVLTRGNHPFDCGDRFMREVNIRKGNYNLQQLDMLGDFAFEARDLISSMLSANPKLRPSATDVMAHPFFWSYKARLNFLCDVSDHFEKEPRDPPSTELAHLESFAPEVVRGDFLKHLPREFVDSLGKQRKYTGSRLLDLLRALRNKKYHYEDMPEQLKKSVGPLPEGYLTFWTTRFPNLLITCWNVVYDLHWEGSDRFKEYYRPMAPPEGGV
ncbi:bifunctional endoribonuclease/protein kinase ire1 [Collariella sp. IMI 366227]|nr:bifunctional endoribonuclease/protein kinase ire1 [Collariella sp. IMI 366227]